MHNEYFRRGHIAIKGTGHVTVCGQIHELLARMVRWVVHNTVPIASRGYLDLWPVTKSPDCQRTQLGKGGITSDSSMKGESASSKPETSRECVGG